MIVGARAVRWGVTAAGLLAGLYAAIVGGASGLGHLAGQARADWYLLAPILAGFGLQVALMAELRQRRRQAHLAAAATDGGLHQQPPFQRTPGQSSGPRGACGGPTASRPEDRWSRRRRVSGPDPCRFTPRTLLIPARGHGLRDRGRGKPCASSPVSWPSWSLSAQW